MPAPSHIQRQSELIFRFLFPSCPQRAARKSLWLPPTFPYVADGKAAVYACLELKSFLLTWGTECSYSVSSSRSEDLPFEELPSLLSKETWLETFLGPWHICWRKPRETLPPRAWAALLPRLRPPPTHGTSRTGTHGKHTGRNTSLQKMGYCLPVRASWKNWQGEFNCDRSNREPQLQNSTYTGAQAAVSLTPASAQTPPSRFSKVRRETLKAGSGSRLWIPSVKPWTKNLPKRGFQTRPRLQLSTSCAHAPDSQRFNPCIEPRVTKSENIFLPAFQTPFSIKGCSCKAAGQIQSLHKCIHFGWWSPRNLSTAWKCCFESKDKKSHH